MDKMDLSQSNIRQLDDIPTPLCLLNHQAQMVYGNHFFKKQFLSNPPLKDSNFLEVFQCPNFPEPKLLQEKLIHQKKGTLQLIYQKQSYTANYQIFQEKDSELFILAFQSMLAATPLDVEATRMLLFESIVLNIRDVVVITEAEPVSLPGPKIVYVNPAFEQQTGYTQEYVKGKTPRILQGPKTPSPQLDILREALLKWQSVEVELINYKKNGEEFWVNLTVVPITDSNGFYTHWLSVQKDVTERKQQEKLRQEAKNKQALAMIKGQEQERTRLARDLHDSVGQMLSTVHLQLQTLDPNHSSLEQIEKDIQHSIDLVSRTIQEVKEVSKNLMPKILLDYGLAKALLQLKINLESSQNIAIDLEIMTDRESFDQQIEITFYRVAQEALSNALKYAQANQLTIQLMEHNQHLQILIEDNGTGFDFEHELADGEGNGLFNMRERIMLLDGSFEIDSVMERGTCIIAEVPLKE